MSSNDPTKAPDEQRRSLLKAAVIAVNGLAASAMGIPVVGYLLGPLMRKKERQWVEAGGLGEFQERQPRGVRLRYVDSSGFREVEQIRNVWIVLEQGAPTVFSSECTHVGCNVLWKPEEDQFICPCHGGAFSPGGEVLAGPPPEPLRRLPSRIENQIVYVEV